MRTKYIKNTVELLYLSLMLRWERTAPPDRHRGLLDGVPEGNTQTSRFAYVLRKIAAGSEDWFYPALSERTRRNDGRSYVSKDASWMIEPYPLSSGWFFEGCTSLPQKQSFVQELTKLGFSPVFVSCLDDFVAGKSVEAFMPSPEEQEGIVQDLIQRGEIPPLDVTMATDAPDHS